MSRVGPITPIAPDNPPGGVMIGGDNGRRAGQRKQLVLRSDVNAHAVGLFRTAEQIGDAALGFEIVEQAAHPFQIAERTKIVEQIGVAAHDQIALVAVAARPARQSFGDQPLGQRVEFGAARFERLFEIGLDFRASSCRGHAR